jgi:hypothetical protein
MSCIYQVCLVHSFEGKLCLIIHFGRLPFFPKPFPKLFGNFQRVWKSLEKLEKSLEKLFQSFVLWSYILIPSYRVLYFQHVLKSTRRGSWQERSLNRANYLSFPKKLSHFPIFQTFSQTFFQTFSKVEIA